MSQEESFKLDRQVVIIDVKDMILADWNYKTDGTEEEIDKLIESIKKDRSIGVLPVREVRIDEKIFFEVVDGNHRLVAARKMGIKKVPCENFGEIDIADAITIARRRNYSWFSDDIFKLQKIMNEHVFAKYPVEELTKFMPESKGFLESLQTMSELPWDKAKDFNDAANSAPPEDGGFTELKIKIPNETLEVWEKLKERFEEILGEPQPDYRVLEFALIEALNIPEERLQPSEKNPEYITGGDE